MKLGCHVSNNGKEMLAGSVKEAISYGANCMMVYIGAPQNTYRKSLAEFNIPKMHELLATASINIDDVIIHAPYIVNLAQPDPTKRDFAVSFLAKDVHYVEAIGAKYIVLHPGAHVGMGTDTGINFIIEGINRILAVTSKTNVTLLIETMSGKGTECGVTFEQIRDIIKGITDQSRIGVCLDTCHIYDGGYDIVNHYDQVIDEFDQIIGLGFLKVIHLNDTKNGLNSHKDRHENIGFGHIGFETIKKFCLDPRFTNIPLILETPYVDDPILKNVSYPPYKEEIAMILSQQFDPNLKQHILSKKQ